MFLFFCLKLKRPNLQNKYSILKCAAYSANIDLIRYVLPLLSPY